LGKKTKDAGGSNGGVGGPPLVLRPQISAPSQVDMELAQDFYNAVMFACQDGCGCLASKILRTKVAPKMFKDMRAKYGDIQESV